MNEPATSAVIVPSRIPEKSGRELAPVSEESSGLLQIIARAARDPSTDLDKMERLLQMQERVMTKRAEQAFVAALSEFKAQPLSIRKNKHVAYGTTEYDHATLDEVCRSVNGGLSAVGLSYRWNTEQMEGGRVRVTCILTHRDGHSERTVLESAPDQSGGKNAIQAIGSAVSYLQRYTLLAALGVATGGADNDGRGALDYVTESQVADLEALITEVGANRAAFLKFLKVTALDKILAKNHHAAVVALESKRKRPATDAQGALV